jgi:hypothetical protein
MQANAKPGPLPVLETLLAGIVGALLGWALIWLLLAGVPAFSAVRGSILGIVFSLVGGAVGGGNGAISGGKQIYQWQHVGGWLAFLLDSTWALMGTMATLVLLLLRPLSPTALYQREYSQRQNRIIYEGGFGLSGLSQTFGPLARITPRVRIPAAMGDPEAIFREAVQHETLHIWQNRLFGPVLYTSYLLWLPLGAVLGCLLGLLVKQPLLLSILDMAYYNNPWEAWAWRWYGPLKGLHHGGLLSVA